MKTQTYTCQHCNTETTRPLARGQRPKWCTDCRAKNAGQRKLGTCERCGIEYRGYGPTYCSRECAFATRVTTKKPRTHWTPEAAEAHARSMWSPLRVAIEAADHTEVIRLIAADCDHTPSGCWEWRRVTRPDGYPTIKVGRRSMQVHRMVLEAKHQAPLGSQQAHHICANTSCVNPDHLQPVTHRDNVAEMLARRSYLARIRELEDALTVLHPTHPLLAVMPVT